MYFEWYPYESFGLDSVAIGVFSLVLMGIWIFYPRWGKWGSILFYWCCVGVVCLVQRMLFDTASFGSFFGLFRVLSWGLFAFGPLACGLVAWRETGVWSKRILWGLGLLLAGIGVDAFWIEPNRLEVTRYQIVDARLKEPRRLVLLADIQTDHIDAHTRKTLRLAMAQQPDLLLFAGDYIQHSFAREYDRQIEPFRKALLAEGMDSVDAFVVEGDAEYRWAVKWHRLFEGMRAKILDVPDGSNQRQSIRTYWKELEIVGLTMVGSREGTVSPTGMDRSREDRFTVVLGHNPNFALHRPDADLYLAGHVHGGQVVLPFVGPLITFSDLPKSQVSGRTELENGATLIVSRGIGMERFDAPRVRFGCLPEIVVIDLLPL